MHTGFNTEGRKSKRLVEKSERDHCETFGQDRSIQEEGCVQESVRCRPCQTWGIKEAGSLVRMKGDSGWFQKFWLGHLDGESGWWCYSKEKKKKVIRKKID